MHVVDAGVLSVPFRRMAVLPVHEAVVAGLHERRDVGGIRDLAAPERVVEVTAAEELDRAVRAAAELAVEVRVHLERASVEDDLLRVLGRDRVGLDADVETALERGGANVLDQREDVSRAVDDVGAVILEREHDAAVLGEPRELADRIDDELARSPRQNRY